MSSQKKRTKFIFINDRSRIWGLAIKTAGIYFLFGLSWLLLSDLAVLLFITNEKARIIISGSKGFLFVVLSSLILFTVFYRSLKKLSDKEQIIREKRNELRVMVYYDPLTGLSNRRKLIERVPIFLNERPELGKALLYIDVDNIKLINDSMGHLLGDYLLSKIALRLSENLSKSEEIFRVGGDEFLILMHFNRLAEIQERATSINNLFETTFSVEKISLHSSVSIGISVFSMHGKDAVELLKFADIAMYQSKKQGKNRAVLFNHTMLTPISERLRIGEQLHQALKNKEFELYMQPQINVTSGKISSFEALLRWKNPILGRVPPNIFIPVAEESRHILLIGEWVLLEACRFIRKLHLTGFSDLSVSVNISILQLMQDNFPDIVLRILKETELNPEALELEITETMLIQSFKQVKKPLENLRNLGIGIALDDFGKGYSSLSYLEQLPITVLKIDKVFIDGIGETEKDTSLTSNIVEIGKKLGLLVVAEGVETTGQLKYLTEQHCDKIQGWIFSKALPQIEAEEFVRVNLGYDQ